MKGGGEGVCVGDEESRIIKCGIVRWREDLIWFDFGVRRLDIFGIFGQLLIMFISYWHMCKLLL